MTNFDRWQLLMKDVCSPQAYVDFSFYFMISSALQRRVWSGPKHQPLFPNMYIVLVGEPAVGKGMSIKPTIELLRYHKWKPEIDSAVDAMARTVMGKRTEHDKEEYLITAAAESITYEALTRLTAEAARPVMHKEIVNGKEKKIPYIHSSVCATLEEMSSMFSKNSDKVVDFLLTAWDCGDYHYKTKHMGEDKIRRCCMSMLAGTTPHFISKTFCQGLISEGFSARTLFIYETKNREVPMIKPELNAEQLAARDVLLEHILKLSKLYGQVKYTPEAQSWLEQWWKDLQVTKPNPSPKLAPYYGKKNMHIQKLGIAIHFADRHTLDEPIDAECFQQADRLLIGIEKQMHLALHIQGRNPLGHVGRQVVQYLIKYGARNFNDLWVQFADDATPNELVELLATLETHGQLRRTKDNRFEAVSEILDNKEKEQNDTKTTVS